MLAIARSGKHLTSTPFTPAGVIADAIDRLPHRPELRTRAEALLVDEATRLNATDLARAAKHLLAVIDPERADRDAEKDLDQGDRAAHLGRFLSITEDGAGGVRVRGRGTVEDAATLKTALLPLTAPAPALDPDTGEDVDPRDHGARLWDALVATAAHALATDLAPDTHGARPRVTITTDLDTLRHGLGLSTAAIEADAGAGGADGRIDWLTLDGAIPVTDDGLALTPGVVRRLACDADIIPVALGTRSEVLDVGRAHRLLTAQTRPTPGLDQTQAPPRVRPSHPDERASGRRGPARTERIEEVAAQRPRPAQPSISSIVLTWLACPTMTVFASATA